MTLPVVAEPLPSSYTFGKVVGRIVHLIADTAEDTDDKPQARAAAGTVTFTPIDVVRRTTETSYPAIVLHSPETATLSASGRLLDGEGRQGIWLAAGTYTVSFTITGSVRTAIGSFDIQVTAAHTDAAPLDLATVVPYQPPTGAVVQTLVVPSGGTAGQALVRAADGGLEWSDQAGDLDGFLLESELPSVTLPTDGTTDIGPLIQAAYDSGRQTVELRPNVTYLWDSPVFLDKTVAEGGFTIQANRAFITLGPNLPTTTWSRDTTTRFAIFPNTKRAALSGGVVTVNDANRATSSLGALRSLIVRDAVIDGQNANRGFAFANRTGCSFEHVTLWRARVCHTWWSYTDCNSYLSCYNRGLGGATSQVFFEQYQAGDGVLVTNPKQNGTSWFGHLTGNRGCQIIGDVASSFYFANCSAVELTGGHFEAQEVEASILSIKASQVSFRGSVFYEHHSNTYPSIVVDDSGSTDTGSEVTFDQCIGMQLWTNDSTNNLFAPMLDLVAASAFTRIVGRGLKGMYATSASGGTWFDGPAPQFRATDATIQALWDSARGRDAFASGEFHFHRNATGQWAMELGQVAYSKRQSAVPSIGSVNVSPGLTGGTLTSGQEYEYAFAVIDALGNYGQVSAVSATTRGTAGAAGMTRLLLNTPNPPASIILWRKTGQGVLTAPDRYIIVPIRSPRMWVYDTGTYMMGRPWLSTSVPVPNTVAATNNTVAAIILNGATITAA